MADDHRELTPEELEQLKGCAAIVMLWAVAFVASGLGVWLWGAILGWWQL